MPTTHSAPRTPPVTTRSPVVPVISDDGISKDANGNVIIKVVYADPNQLKEANDLRASGLWAVEFKGDDTMAGGMNKLATAYEILRDKTRPLAERSAAALDLIAGLRTVIGECVVILEGTATEPVPSGQNPAYQGLSGAAAAAADGADRFPLETHNAHADTTFLREGGATLDNLQNLSTVMSDTIARITLTTVPLARKLYSTVGAVCQAAAPALPQNASLKSTLARALDYLSANAVKAKKTKAKLKAVKQKTTKDTTGTTGTPTPAKPPVVDKGAMG